MVVPIADRYGERGDTYIYSYQYQLVWRKGVRTFILGTTNLVLKTRGVSHCVALLFTLKKYLKAKEEL